MSVRAYTAQNVRDAVFAHTCRVLADADGGDPLAVAVDGLETRVEQRAARAQYARGAELLDQGLRVVHRCPIEASASGIRPLQPTVAPVLKMGDCEVTLRVE